MVVALKDTKEDRLTHLHSTSRTPRSTMKIKAEILRAEGVKIILNN